MENDKITPDMLHTLRHSAAHLMAHAIRDLYPESKFAIGPPIDTGFYYDIDLKTPIKTDDLPRIKKRMQELVKQNLPYVRREIPKEEALEIVKQRGEIYKTEILEGIPEKTVSFYTMGNFDDLCEGPHVATTGAIRAFELLSVAGAYWRGDEKNPMLQRIYGTAFFSEEELDHFLKNLEEASKRDHRKLGKELDLFSFHEEAGGGLVYYHPKGAMLRWILEDYLRQEHGKRGYQFVVTPHLSRMTLYDRSGHASYYRENMYTLEIDKQEYAVKPMNCPSHILIFKRKIHSYRELPVKYFELGTVYRYEKSGVLHGMLRVRGFTQDDSHIFCRLEQVESVVRDVLDFIDSAMKRFGFDYALVLSTRPEKYAGDLEHWEAATVSLKAVLEATGKGYEIDEGGGVFYGPKIDVMLKDALGRVWQGPTVQVDFNLPERFDLTYDAENGTKQRPVMVHRAILGSIERFIGALVEHYGGAFPFWLAPTQVMVLAVSERHNDAVAKVVETLKAADIRVEADVRNEKIGHKIREAQLQQIPYMLVVGDKEVQASTVSVRDRREGDKGTMGLQQFIDFVKEKVL